MQNLRRYAIFVLKKKKGADAPFTFCFVFFRLLILRTELRQGKRLRKNRS